MQATILRKMQSQIGLKLAEMAKNAETLRNLNGGIQTIVDEEILELLDRLIKIEGELPTEFKEQYKSLTEQVNKRLPFINSKIEWCECYPDFKRISEIMEDFKSNELLREFCQSYPLKSHESKVIGTYKKCISFRTKFTKKIANNLRLQPSASFFHYQKVEYCIDSNTVNNFLKRYQTWLWSERLHEFWSELYNLRQDYIFNAGYDRISWKTRTASPALLRSKLEEVETLHKNLLRSLRAEAELLFELDEIITLEYNNSPLEMSLYEREREIAQIDSSGKLSDEEYCYVYTLECELFVFYVGIAADPKERFEQHIRGAFSDEAHLFKSKFIQKFHLEVKQSIVFEGFRRECKDFERSYIAEFRPLGNMTEGGEG